MHFFGALVNVLLAAACLYAMYSLTPADNPYGYLAASFTFVHGLLGLVRSFTDELDECGRTFVISASILEVIPLPLANIEFYLVSDHSGVALVHGLSLIPLFYDMLGKMGDEWDSSTETLKDLALIGNIASTSYLAIKDGNHIYAAIAATAFIVRFGAALIDRFVEGLGAHAATVGNAGILALMTYALTEG
ncbi:uncharacterized protein LOC108147882 [Drosophila elegans]|uniref:uncharacterized protein LOC108147882 n=1 Tax=Drosophila elegans TaxID=30023 RepID=UPI0007E88302|nr:uncharacterized protein LOC108147882 [Drosophila elegans]